MGLGSNGAFVIGAPFTNGGYGYGFASSVGYTMLDSVELLVNDVSIQYPGHGCCITGLLG